MSREDLTETSVEQGYGRVLEREAVVAWLRRRSKDPLIDSEACYELDEAADAIETGEHLV